MTLSSGPRIGGCAWRWPTVRGYLLFERTAGKSTTASIPGAYRGKIDFAAAPVPLFSTRPAGFKTPGTTRSAPTPMPVAIPTSWATFGMVVFLALAVSGASMVSPDSEANSVAA